MPDVLIRRFLIPAALLALVAAALLATAPAASAKAKTCGEKVVDDWYGDGRVDEVFPTHCYLDAIRSLPVDVKDYSNAEEDIRRALAYAQQHKADPGPRGGPAPTDTDSRPVDEPTTTSVDGPDDPRMCGHQPLGDLRRPIRRAVVHDHDLEPIGERRQRHQRLLDQRLEVRLLVVRRKEVRQLRQAIVDRGLGRARCGGGHRVDPVEAGVATRMPSTR